VNHALGKNLIGAFYQPQCVLIRHRDPGLAPRPRAGLGVRGGDQVRVSSGTRPSSNGRRRTWRSSWPGETGPGVPEKPQGVLTPSAHHRVPPLVCRGRALGVVRVCLRTLHTLRVCSVKV